MKKLSFMTAALAVGTVACTSPDKDGKRHYAGPTVKASVGWNGIDVGLTLYGRTPEIPAQPQLQIPLTTK